MAKRLGPNESVTIRTLIEKNHNNVAIARLLDITEGAVRYQRAKLAQPPKVDGRKDKPQKLHGFEEALRSTTLTIESVTARGATSLNSGGTGERSAATASVAS